MRLAAVITLLLLPATTIVTDPRDAGGKLDLSGARAARDGALLRLTVSTYGPWASKLLRSGGQGKSGPLPGRNRMTVLYDVTRDGRADYRGRVVYHGRLAMWLTGRGQAFEPVPVSRPSASSARFVHPVDIFFTGRGVQKLGMAVTTVNGTHRDRMPNRGWFIVVYVPPGER